MEVARPVFQLGFKCDPLGQGEKGIYWEFVGDLAAEVLFGESSELYLQLYEEGLIDPSFGGGLDTVPNMALLTATGDSDDPLRVRDAILQRAKQIAEQGIPEKDFLRIKRSTLGGRIRSLDSFDSVCFRICAYYFSGFDYFYFPEVYESVKIEDVQEFIRKNVTEERCSLSVIEPKEETQ
jgi:predicted Zn-dependent peptidase